MSEQPTELDELDERTRAAVWTDPWAVDPGPQPTRAQRFQAAHNGNEAELYNFTEDVPR